MKKMLFLVIALITFTLTAQAKTEEWIDKSFDFTTPKTIGVELRLQNELFNGIRENEISEIFYKTLTDDFYDKLPKSKYKLISYQQIMNNFMKENNIDAATVQNLSADKLKEIDKKLIEYARNYMDVFFVCHVWIYDLGTSYHEGYYYTLPSQVYSTVTTNIGINATVTTNGQTLHHRPGGNFPTAYCLVRWDIIDSKTNKPIWSRIDDRARVNMDVLQNTKPKDLLRRIVKSMSSDLLKRMKIRN